METNVQEDECCICLISLNHKETTTTDCNHTFHLSCLQEWRKLSSSCPLCRFTPEGIQTPVSAHSNLLENVRQVLRGEVTPEEIMNPNSEFIRGIIGTIDQETMETITDDALSGSTDPTNILGAMGSIIQTISGEEPDPHFMETFGSFFSRRYEELDLEQEVENFLEEDETPEIKEIFKCVLRQMLPPRQINYRLIPTCQINPVIPEDEFEFE